MLCLVVLLSVAGSELAIAQILKLQNPLIVNGERFTNPVYDSHDASRLFITHKTGATGLPIDDLPYELQVRLGYNRSNALAAEEAHIKRQEQAEVKSQADQEGMLEQATAAATKAEMVNRKAASMLQPSSNEYDGGESSRSAVAETVNSSPTWAETQFVRGSMGQWEPVQTLEPAMVPAGFPEEWGGRPAGNSSRAKRKQQEWDEQRALQIASQAGPEAVQAYIERSDAAKVQQSLQNIEFQQMQLQRQLKQLERQQQNRSMLGW
jgi:uncharacterized protein YhaN